MLTTRHVYILYNSLRCWEFDFLNIYDSDYLFYLTYLFIIYKFERIIYGYKILFNMSLGSKITLIYDKMILLNQCIKIR